jgi:hypothetical protein
MGVDNITYEQHLIPCRAELASPTTDWSLSWQAFRQPGVPPDLASFLWRMLLNLLSTKAKLHRMGTIRSSLCKMQGCTGVGTLYHELLYGFQTDGVLRLDHVHVDDDKFLPTPLLPGTILSILWKERQAGQSIRAYKVRAELEQSINLLRTTRFTQTAAFLRDMSQIVFH